MSDEALKTALAAQLGHAPPFSRAELEGVRTLALHGIETLPDLSACPGIEVLSLHCCGALDLTPLASLARLRRLAIESSLVSALDPLARCAGLCELELIFCAATSLAPLCELPLQRTVLLGCPWSIETVAQDRARLIDRAQARGVVLVWSETTEWELTRKLWERGITAGFATLNGEGPYLVWPGPTRREDGACEHVAVPPAWLAPRLKEPPAGFESIRTNALAKAAATDGRDHREPGTPADAAAWIAASSLPDAERKQLSRFARAFVSATFFRDDDWALARLKASAAVKLPEWLCALRRTLAFVEPQLAAHSIRVHFLGMLGDSEPASRYGGHQFSLGLFGYNNADQRALLEPAGLLPFAWSQSGQAFLAIDTRDEADHKIYLLDDEFAFDAGDKVREAAHPVFSSYAEMLSLIGTVYLPERTLRRSADDYDEE